MRRVLKIVLVLFGVLLAVAFTYGRSKNPERLDLAFAARDRAPGDFVPLADGMTHYEVAGPDTGRVVVLVHGFSVPAYIWDSTSVALSQAGYRVIRYDVFGRGWSDRPDVAYDSATFVNQLNGLLDSLRIDTPIDLVGLSFGGYVTGQFTATHPERIRTLTLVDPVAQARSVPSVLSYPIIGPWIWQVTQVPGMADGQLTDFLHPENYPTWVDQYRPQMRYRGFGRSLLRSAITSGRTNFDSLYSRVAKTNRPVLLIWGQQDETIPIALSEVIRRAIPTAEYFPVDSAGHLPHIEQSAAVHARMREFFAAHPRL